VIKIRVTSWYRNGNLDTLQIFCVQNRYELITIRLIDSLEPIQGVLYDYRLMPSATSGIFILLTRALIHPAFYSLDDIESLHYLDPVITQPLRDV